MASATDADYYDYLIGERVIASWCGREIEGTVVAVDAVAGFNERSIDVRIQLGDATDGSGPVIATAPDAIRDGPVADDE